MRVEKSVCGSDERHECVCEVMRGMNAFVEVIRGWNVFVEARRGRC